MKALQFVKSTGVDIKNSRIEKKQPNKIKISRSMLNFLIDFLDPEFKQLLENTILKLDPFQVILVLMSLILNKVHKLKVYGDLSEEIANVSFSLLEIFKEDED